MAIRKITTMAVDIKFFDNIFEKERRKMQEKIGISNLTQANFTKMIKGFKIKKPKRDLSQFIARRRRRKNVRI